MAIDDLFAWRDQADAAAAVTAAEDDRAAALKRYRFAPRGTVRDREQRALEATAEALRAEISLDQVRRGEAS